jgi:hypothetical protein
MNFFQPIQNNPNASFETVEKKRIGYWTGLTLPKEMVEARVSSRKGYKTSLETRAKLSAANKGRVLVRDSSLISKALTGVPKSEEHRKKLSEAAKGRPASKHLISYNSKQTQNAFRYEGLTVKEWAEVFNVSRDCIRDHLKRNGHLNYVGRTSGWAKCR